MPDTKKQIRVDPLHPDARIIQKAGAIIQQNGVVIFPAQCLYGVAANALDPDAVEKVFTLKNRPKDNPILVLIPDRTHLPSLVKSIPKNAITLMDTFWPGHLTIVFEAADHIPERLTAGTGKIGIRVPMHPVACELVKALNIPITGTSANISGSPGCCDPALLEPDILSRADLFLDAGMLKGGTGSTIVDVTRSSPQILRQGEIPTARIKDCLKMD